MLAVELPGSVAHLLGALLHILHYAVESVLLSAHLVTLAHCPCFGNHEPEDNVCRKRNPEPEAVARQGEEQEQDDGQQAEQQGFLVEIGRKAGADASEYLVVGVAVELALLSAAVAVGRFSLVPVRGVALPAVAVGCLVGGDVADRAQGVADFAHHLLVHDSGASAFLKQQLGYAHLDLFHDFLSRRIAGEMPLQRVEVGSEQVVGSLFEGEGGPAYADFHYRFHICPFFIFSMVLTISVHAASISRSCERPLSVME